MQARQAALLTFHALGVGLALQEILVHEVPPSPGALLARGEDLLRQLGGARLSPNQHAHAEIHEDIIGGLSPSGAPSGVHPARAGPAHRHRAPTGEPNATPVGELIGGPRPPKPKPKPLEPFKGSLETSLRVTGPGCQHVHPEYKNTCDYFTGQGLTCTTLERDYGFDCTGCTCSVETDRCPYHEFQGAEVNCDYLYWSHGWYCEYLEEIGYDCSGCS